MSRFFDIERCGATRIIGTFGTQIACDLRAGHYGPHQCGGSQNYVEWPQDGDSPVRDFEPKSNLNLKWLGELRKVEPNPAIESAFQKAIRAFNVALNDWIFEHTGGDVDGFALLERRSVSFDRIYALIPKDELADYYPAPEEQLAKYPQIAESEIWRRIGLPTVDAAMRVGL